MNEAELKRLLQQYFDSTISYADSMKLLGYLKDADPVKIEGHISEDMLKPNNGIGMLPEQARQVWERITADARYAPASRQLHVIKFYQKTWFQVAATLLVFLTAGLLLFTRQPGRPATGRHYVQQKSRPIIQPGNTKALLTTDDGKVLVLDRATNGLIAKNGGTNIIKANSGQILYQEAGQLKPTALQQVSNNTLTTPKGGEYQVILADGTKVWLNNASSITYPTAFNGAERRVKLSGEAYFEVAKDSSRPFYVNTANGQIRVLGTHFDVSAYADDEFTSTTLLEGAVQVTKNGAFALLKPGQQASIGKHSDRIKVTKANIEEAMAWKNGYFIFDNDNIGGIMKKISRWYDVDVQYKGSFEKQKFGGTFHRSKSITDLLHDLEKIGGIHFTVTGRRIIVMN